MLADILDTALGAIHFTFDLWTSTNNLALLGVVGHWIVQDGTIQ